MSKGGWKRAALAFVLATAVDSSVDSLAVPLPWTSGSSWYSWTRFGSRESALMSRPASRLMVGHMLEHKRPIATSIGERGSKLSMGQRQLVVFARVLFENPAILILDEATASVDPFTETRIQDALQKTIEGRTSIIIAHRLWTVRHVDRIIVLDHGKIVEEGNHDQLIEKNGVYAELYNTYFRHQSLEYIEKMKKIV